MTDSPAPADAAAEMPEEDIIEQKAVRLAKRERLIEERADAAGGAYPVTLPIKIGVPAGEKTIVECLITPAPSRRFGY